MSKSASKRWRESGTELGFKEWINIENSKNKEGRTFLPFMNESNPDISTATLDSLKQDLKVASGYKKETSGSVFGLNKSILVFSAVLIVGSLGYLIYSSNKSK